MKKIISMISIMIIIISFISIVFATNIEVNSIIEATVNEIVEANVIIDTEVNEIVDNTTDDEVSNKITKEQFEEAIKNGKGTYNKEITNDEIIFSDKYRIKYEISNIPTFRINMNINKEIEWDEYGDEISKCTWFLPIIKAVFKCKNVDEEYIEKIGVYFADKMFDGIGFVDITIDNYMNYNLIEETKKVYGNYNIDNEIFTIKTEEKEVTEENYSLDFIMTINENVDYKNIIDKYWNEMIEEENQNEISNINTIENIENIGINEIPQTGKTLDTEDILWIILISSVSVFALYCVCNRRKNGKE